MLHFGILEIETPLFLAIVTVLMMLLQLFLCLKATRKVIKALLVIVLGAISALFLLLVPFFDGWDAVGFIFIAVWTAVVALICGAVLAIHTIIVKNKKQ